MTFSINILVVVRTLLSMSKPAFIVTYAWRQTTC